MASFTSRSSARARPARRAARAVLLALVVLGLMALAQVVVFIAPGSVALLADLIHNTGDAATAIPLGIALALRRARALAEGARRPEGVRRHVRVGPLLAKVRLFGTTISPSATRRLWRNQVATDRGTGGNTGGIGLGGILVIVGIVLMIVWSFWVGLIVALVGLIAFGGFAKGKWY
jgi:hypothetical protein